MSQFRFKKELYSKISLIKAAYNYTDKAYLHLDSDVDYYIVNIEPKDGQKISEKDFINEMLTQSVRHEVYLQTHHIRELLLARALATSVVDESVNEYINDEEKMYNENDILRDWFETNEE